MRFAFLAGFAAVAVLSGCARPADTVCPTEAPAGPIAYGRTKLAAALIQAGATVQTTVATVDDCGIGKLLAKAGVVVDTRAESYAVFSSNGGVIVVGRDPTGAMYGALELAERITLDGPTAALPKSPILGSPRVPIRAANLFLVLPAPGETAWWFYDEGFWREYLDMCATARIDLLDLHGMYNLENTIFPNALLYFGASASHPEIGVPAADRAKNIGMLNHIIDMAQSRGVQVALMTYNSTPSITGDDHPNVSEGALAEYTHEAARDLATNAPRLTRIGFRIGEGGHDASWFAQNLVAGVNDAKNGVGVYTRTWGASKPDILKIVAASARPDTIVEAKFNGEHLGSPYAIEGGLMSHGGAVDWSFYSYADYLDPPTPYNFVFQIRSGGTHRLFRYASYDRTKRTLDTVMLASSRGFTLEAAHAYFPQRDFYHANPSDRFSDWTFRRDELAYSLFGRLGYDPATPERVFRAELSRRTGTDALWESVQAASEIVPWIQAARTCGPDSRYFAPDLEWGGTVGYWSLPRNVANITGDCKRTGYQGPYDTFAIASPSEVALDLVSGKTTTRSSPIDIAALVLADAASARKAANAVVDPSNAEARDIVRECVALADLGDYFGHKLRGATALAVYRASSASDYLAAARDETGLADAAWSALAADTGYIQPFEDHLRMQDLGMPTYHWSLQVPHLTEDAASISAVEADVQSHPPPFTGTLPPASSWLFTERAAGLALASISATQGADPTTSTVIATFTTPVPLGAKANILYKRVDGFDDWATAAGVVAGSQVSATVPLSSGTNLFAVEIATPSGGYRYPDVLHGTPYIVAP